MTSRPLMFPEILSKHLRSLAVDVRLGTRLMLRRWRQLDRATRSRIELGTVFSLLPLSAALAAIAAAPAALDLDAVQSRPIVEDIRTPRLDDQLAHASARGESFVREARVQRGEPFGVLLLRLGIDDDEAARFIRADPTAHPLVRVAPGRFVQASITADGRLEWLRAYGDGDDSVPGATSRVLAVTRDSSAPDGFRVSESEATLERRVELRSGEIKTSLFAAADDAEVPDSIAQEMVDALENEVDFHRSLRDGDRFRVIYEALYAGGEYLRPGRLLAVEFVNDGRPLEAFWFDDGSKRGGYYAPGGRSMKRAFLRSPLEYTRVSSGFSGSRTHPLFGYDAAHRGIDYSAPMGSKVRTIAGGVVELAGWQNGYGNVVEIRHDSRHSTLYAHLQKFGAGIVKGARVSQGDLIGYVGMTGWATGPHLHFETKIAGRNVNPLTAQLPSAEPLDESRRDALAAVAAPLREQLALLERIRVAASTR
jgi:murein DD-endopeptidase MepM/ murein hydrolase activator NlpD